MSILSGNNRGEKALGDLSIVMNESHAILPPFQIKTPQKRKENHEVIRSTTAFDLGEKSSYTASSLT
jgi:hypothetical protein